MTLFVATPLHDKRMHEGYTYGLLTAWASGLAGRWTTDNGTALARQRDTLAAKFLESDCTHLLWVDADIGWHASHAVALLATGRDMVGGCYARKCAGSPLVAKLLPNREGELYEAEHIGTGFLLCSRSAVERMTESRRDFRYQHGPTTITSLCQQNLSETTEDLAFCRTWRECGGQIWIHTGVVVDHFDGGTPYFPNVSELRAHLAPAQAAE